MVNVVRYRFEFVKLTLPEGEVDWTLAKRETLLESFIVWNNEDKFYVVFDREKYNAILISENK